MLLFNESNQSNDERGNVKKRQSHFTHHHYQCFRLFAAVILSERQSIKTPNKLQLNDL